MALPGEAEEHQVNLYDCDPMLDAVLLASMRPSIRKIPASVATATTKPSIQTIYVVLGLIFLLRRPVAMARV
jgi:hypothetical protein